MDVKRYSSDTIAAEKVVAQVICLYYASAILIPIELRVEYDLLSHMQ